MKVTVPLLQYETLDFLWEKTGYNKKEYLSKILLTDSDIYFNGENNDIYHSDQHGNITELGLSSYFNLIDNDFFYINNGFIHNINDNLEIRSDGPFLVDSQYVYCTRVFEEFNLITMNDFDDKIEKKKN